MPRFLLVLLAALLGCPPSAPEEPDCTRNSDCRLGETCKDGVCRAGCDTDRDCPDRLRCDLSMNACVFPSVDGGADAGRDAGTFRDAGSTRDAGVRRDAAVPVLDASLPLDASTAEDASAPDASPPRTLPEESACSPVRDECLPGLRCVPFAAPVGPRCMALCDVEDGGPMACAPGRTCTVISSAEGACIRTAGRDESCLSPDGGVDPMVACALGLAPLVDDQLAPRECACKQFCTLADCPGPNCTCPPDEECVAGVLGGGVNGVCGEGRASGEACEQPFTYPFYSSVYCEAPAGVPGPVQPLPYCYFTDLLTLESACHLLCMYPSANGTTFTPCPSGQACLPGDPDIWGPMVRTCQPPPPDAGQPDSGVPTRMEETCDPFTNDCGTELTCINFTAPLGPRCLPECDVDGGCATGRGCVPLSNGQRVCLRTVGRDESCLRRDGGVDRLAACEEGLDSLVDNPQNPSECACKQLCTLASCPGPQCECADPETCVADVLSSSTVGMCGTARRVGEACEEPFTYPFYSSLYCAVPEMPLGTPEPIPYCQFGNLQTLQSICYLICEYPTSTGPVTLGCPEGFACRPGNPQLWAPGVRTCEPAPVMDAGMGMDGGMLDAG